MARQLRPPAAAPAPKRSHQAPSASKENAAARRDDDLPSSVTPFKFRGDLLSLVVIIAHSFYCRLCMKGPFTLNSSNLRQNIYIHLNGIKHSQAFPSFSGLDSLPSLPQQQQLNFVASSTRETVSNIDVEWVVDLLIGTGNALRWLDVQASRTFILRLTGLEKAHASVQVRHPAPLPPRERIPAEPFPAPSTRTPAPPFPASSTHAGTCHPLAVIFNAGRAFPRY
jgi:hypothetical protein